MSLELIRLWIHPEELCYPGSIWNDEFHYWEFVANFSCLIDWCNVPTKWLLVNSCFVLSISKTQVYWIAQTHNQSCVFNVDFVSFRQKLLDISLLLLFILMVLDDLFVTFAIYMPDLSQIFWYYSVLFVLIVGFLRIWRCLHGSWKCFVIAVISSKVYNMKSWLLFLRLLYGVIYFSFHILKLGKQQIYYTLF